MPDAPVPFRLPDLGEGMAEAEIVEWFVRPGDHVERDQTVVHVQTDKAVVELPAPEAGTVVSLGASVGDVVPVGGLLLELAPATGAAGEGDDEAWTVGRPLPAADGDGALPYGVTPTPAATTPRPQPAPARPAAREATEDTTSPRTSPAVRRLARDLGVDLTAVGGSGPEGRVTADDVRAALDLEPIEMGGDRRVPLRGVRRSMARNMAEAWRTIPHASLFDEIDARALVDAHRMARELGGEDAQSLTLTAFFVRASVIALRANPILNASLDLARDEVVEHDACHIGVAVATEDGLIVPVVRNAQDLDLLEIGNELARLTAAARHGTITPAELANATFTITNFGTQGGRFATPIIRPPQVGILGCGAIRPQPVVDNGNIIAAPALPLSLSMDHRVVDGAQATAFIDTVGRLLRQPVRLFSDAFG